MSETSWKKGRWGEREPSKMIKLSDFCQCAPLLNMIGELPVYLPQLAESTGLKKNFKTRLKSAT